MQFNEKLKTIKIRELFVVFIVAAILIAIGCIIFPIIEEDDDLYYILFLFMIILFFTWKLKDTTGFNSNIREVFKISTQKENIYLILINLFFTVLIFIITYTLGMPDGSSDFETTTELSVILGVLSTDILGPIVEELVFRGVLFNRLQIRTGIIPAILISSIIFGALHDGNVGMISAFVFGVCMCILYLKTGNIFVTISLHMLNNILVDVMGLLNIEDLAFVGPYWMIPLTIIGVISTVLLIKYLYDGFKKVKSLT